MKGSKKTVVSMFTPPIMEVQLLKEKGETLVFKFELAVNLVLMFWDFVNDILENQMRMVIPLYI